METHFTLIPNGVKETFFDYMDNFFSDSRSGDGVASEYLLLNGRISEGLSSMYRYYLKQDMNEQEVRIAYGHRIVLSLCNLCGLIFSADHTVSNIDVDEQSMIFTGLIQKGCQTTLFLILMWMSNLTMIFTGLIQKGCVYLLLNLK